MNILLTSAGRRNYLVRYFREASKARGQGFATDLDPNAAALQEADKAFEVPRFSDPSYFDQLHRLCIEHDVGLVVSLNDLELPLLAREKDRFTRDGIHVQIGRASCREVR